MRRAVLMPGDRRAEAGLLHEGHFVVGNEIVAQDRCRHGQQSGMAVEAQAGVAQVKISVEQFDGPGRCILAGLWLQHGGRMAAVVLVRPADRIAQRPGPAIGWLQDPLGRGRPPVAIDCGIGRHRRARQHGVDVGAQLLQLLGPDDALEYVEAVRPVDFRMSGRSLPSAPSRIGPRLPSA